MILLSSPSHPYPSVVGVGHDLPLCYTANSLPRAWGCGDTYSTTSQSRSCLYTLWSVLRDVDQLTIYNLSIAIGYVQAHSPPLVPPLDRDMQNSWLYLRLPFQSVATCTVVSPCEMTYWYAIRFFLRTGATRCLGCLLYTSPSPRDKRQSRMPSSA